jgi:FkbM family methyltransferase
MRSTMARECGQLPVAGRGAGCGLPFSFRLWTGVGRCLPAVRGSGWLALHVLRRITRGPLRCEMPVWPGIRMVIEPGDYLGAILAFVPHLYDRWERQAMAAILRTGDVFVDIGGNIGAYALWAANLVGAAGRVVAVEPDCQNRDLLVRSVALNDFRTRVTVLSCGTSDRREKLRMHRNTTGNCGGHNFMGKGEAGQLVECLPLRDALDSASAGHIRLMKLDIEGFERRVLEPYFACTPPVSRPDYLLVEIEGGPAPASEKRLVRSLVLGNGYILVREGANALFRRTDVRE